MKSLWTDQGAREAIRRWAGAHGKAVAARLYAAELLGQDRSLVLHGGGNVSVKASRQTPAGETVEALYVKGSGRDLAEITLEDLVPLDLGRLRRLARLDELDDDAMANELGISRLNATDQAPSIETLMHAFLPHTFVDHSHADAVLVLANQADGEKMVRDALGDRVAVLPYVRPGFALAKAVGQCHRDHPDVEGIVLLQHGLVTFSDDAGESYERHIDLVDTCERFIGQRRTAVSVPDSTSNVKRGLHSSSARAATEKLAVRIAPMLRGLLASPTGDEDRPHDRSILEWRCGADLMALIDGPGAKELADAGPLTGDHVIHTKPKALFIEPGWPTTSRSTLPDRATDDDQPTDVVLCERLTDAVQMFRRDYRAYVQEHGRDPDAVDASPRVVLVPGVGMFCTGRSKQEACVVADIAEHTLAVKSEASAIGTYSSLPPPKLFDMEFRRDQRAKLATSGNRPLDGQVVIISGGAGAIGAAVAEVCAESGAHVAIADLDRDRLATTVQRLEQRFPTGTIIPVSMDVTDERSVRSGFDEVVRTFGGVDVVVPNAGIAHVASIETMDVADFRRVMDINAVGYLLFMREGIRILKRQGIGGHIVINASKNVFGPGKDFGAYSASKAAGHQLGKVAAIELAPFNIRVNMINADAVFGDSDSPSGLWATVGPDRAQSRSMKVEDLPDYYRGRNLLKARVTGRHVGNAVVFFATNLTPTTGATLPVDGGLADAFPR